MEDIEVTSLRAIESKTIAVHKRQGSYKEMALLSVIGVSEHALDNNTAITSVAAGVSIIKRNFTLDRTGGWLDNSFSGGIWRAGPQWDERFSRELDKASGCNGFRTNIGEIGVGMIFGVKWN